jgi:hypothetical protein
MNKELTLTASCNSPVKFTSLELAEMTGKLHKHVMRDIREEIGKIGELDNGLTFELVDYTDPTGRKLPCYELSKKFADRFLTKHRFKAKRKKTKYIYILKCDIAYKIGVAGSVASRLRSCQTGNPLKITCEYSRLVRNPKTVESLLHTLFSEKRMSGEWFALNSRDVIKAKQIITENSELGMSKLV